MTQGKTGAFFAALLVLIGLGIAVGGNKSPSSTPETAPAANPALSVRVIQPTIRDIPIMLTANGSIAAWQEAIIGSEISELRLTAVNVQIGDTVKKGQVLAVFSDESVLADVAQSRAVVAEAEANLADARLNANGPKRYPLPERSVSSKSTNTSPVKKPPVPRCNWPRHSWIRNCYG